MTIDLASLQSRDGARRVFAGPGAWGVGGKDGFTSKRAIDAWGSHSPGEGPISHTKIFEDRLQ